MLFGYLTCNMMIQQKKRKSNVMNVGAYALCQFYDFFFFSFPFVDFTYYFSILIL